MLGFVLGSGMGGFCGRTCGLFGPFGVTRGLFGVTGFGGSGGVSGSTGELVNLFGITYASSVSSGRGGIGGGSGFVLSDPDRDGGFDLGGGGGGVSGKINLSNIGLLLSIKLASFNGLAPLGFSL